MIKAMGIGDNFISMATGQQGGHPVWTGAGRRRGVARTERGGGTPRWLTQDAEGHPQHDPLRVVRLSLIPHRRRLRLRNRSLPHFPLLKDLLP